MQLQSLPKQYKSLHDILIRTEKGLTQIDHVVISPYGIYVIEAKNYTGWIFGNQYDKYWTQTFGKKKQRFYNPIRQNYGHVQALKTILSKNNFKNIQFYSIISFSRRAELRGIKSEIPVVFDTELARIIERKKNGEVLNEKVIENIYHILEKMNIQSTEMRRQHIMEVKRKNV